MNDPVLLATVIATFLLAGMVKGVIGLGLPTVSLGLLAVATDLTTAMALLLVPSFATNLWQACGGGNIGALLFRIWPFLLTAGAAVWLGAAVLIRADLALLSMLLGGLLVAYGGISLGGIRPRINVRQEIWAGPATGMVNGILTGMTGSFVVPGVMYLQALGLPRDMLVQAMGMLFTISTVALALTLNGNGYITMNLGLVSAAATIPAIIGMVFGQMIRNRLSEDRFRRVFFFALLVLGTYIAVRAGLNFG